jgi:hypothetical protein
VSLATLFPAPRPLPIAGRVWLASPLRLRDLAHLEQWAAGVASDPFAAIADAQAIPDAGARRAALRAVYESIEAAEDFWQSETAGLLSTRAGVAEQFRLTLRSRRGRRPSASLALRLACDVTAEEYAAWEAVAWCADPLDAAAAAIDREIGVTWPSAKARPPADPDAPRGWAGAVFTAIAGVAGPSGMTGGIPWTLDQYGDLTLGQWRWLASGGKPGHPIAEPKEPPSGVPWGEFERRVNAPRRAFWAAGETGETAQAGGEG